MKILSWNCNGAFRNKFKFLESLNADILVIQECENPAESKDANYKSWASNYLWIGDSKNKGLGVFAKKDILLEKLDWSDQYQDHKVKYFLPCQINGQFNLCAVWTHKNNSPTFGYIGQFWKYLQLHKQKLTDIIILGDFNSNSRWDSWDRWWNHSNVVDELSEIGIESTYHSFYDEKQGQEKQPTFYLHRNLDKSYHIDYCFASNHIISKMQNITVGEFKDWKQLSDHNPIIVTFEFEEI
ncbi:endonuclease/exonuclease/phosphatase family protein [Flavobacterium sp.]|uniref:endonuclease/exonuclease/phosphatase family protein n=1 Tax=Flavobacterium sp. TaxID=239 RepID=UPI00262DBC79|nr:endonuclease/exonuclease/phosphatase family protein [Flavobacterium sp.]MDG2432810.1 endonuclease/exonuclease/phosphatase family protein [Flavobacterium sp.]